MSFADIVSYNASDTENLTTKLVKTLFLKRREQRRW